MYMRILIYVISSLMTRVVVEEIRVTINLTYHEEDYHMQTEQ